MAITRVSKTLGFSFVAPDIVYSDATVVFSVDATGRFAVLQSNVHAAFAWQYTSRLKNDLRYSPTDALEPFPWPDGLCSDSLERLGEQFNEMRRSLMVAEQIGLTSLYSRFHEPENRDPSISTLRELHRDMDLAVARAYGWDDLELDHGFHEVSYLPGKDRVRFTISEAARIEVLRRLAHLNRLRYEEEVAQGLHAKANGKKGSRPGSTSTSIPETMTTGPQQARLDL